LHDRLKERWSIVIGYAMSAGPITAELTSIVPQIALDRGPALLGSSRSTASAELNEPKRAQHDISHSVLTSNALLFVELSIITAISSFASFFPFYLFCCVSEMSD
jgi:hypothetical protein